MDIMVILQIIVLLGAIFVGVRLGGIGIGYAGGAGVLILGLNCLHDTGVSADYKSTFFIPLNYKNISTQSSLFYVDYILLQEDFLITFLTCSKQ